MVAEYWTDSVPRQGRPLKTPRVQKDMPSSKVSNARCSSGVYSWRRSSERTTAILSKSLVKLSLIQILPTSGWDCFRVWFPKLLISVGDSLSSGSAGPIRLNHKVRQGSNPFTKPGFQGQIPKLLSRMVYSTIIRDLSRFRLLPAIH